MHEHIELNHAHVLLYCNVCDIVYCEGCKKEWRKELPKWTYTTSPYVWYSGTGHDHFTVNNDLTGTITIT